MREAAFAHLERLLRAREGNAAARDSKPLRGEGAIVAYERLGLLAPEEAARWRARFSGREGPGVDTSGLRGEARVAGERYLTALVDRVPALRRDPDPAAIGRAAECATAIRALHAVGVLDADEEASWRARLLRAQAPWLGQTPPAPTGAAQAVFVPPENEQQAAEDAAHAAAWANRPRAREVYRVIVGSPERKADLALVALVVHEDAASLHFHHLAGPQSTEAHGFDALAAYSKLVDSLSPPSLCDEPGRTYEPVDQRPSSASGTGGIPNPSRRQAISGAWQYTPAAPDRVHAFRAERGKTCWDLPNRS